MVVQLKLHNKIYIRLDSVRYQQNIGNHCYFYRLRDMLIQLLNVWRTQGCYLPLFGLVSCFRSDMLSRRT